MNQTVTPQQSIRGGVITGVVKSAKAPKTVTVERTLTTFLPKYERYKKTRSRVHAHVPAGMKVEEGDMVKLGETRKISKTKNFVVMEVVRKGTEIERERITREEEFGNAEKVHMQKRHKEEKNNESN